MSFTRGELLSKTMKLVKGQAKRDPVWLRAMQQSPPVAFPPPPHGKVPKIDFPEDRYIKKFYAKYPDSLYHDAVRINGFDPPPSRVFAHRVLELKSQLVNEENAIAIADMEYRNAKRAKKNAFKELKIIARLQGKKPPPNPYPSAIKEIQAEEEKYFRDRVTNPKTLELVEKMKEDRAIQLQVLRSKGLD